MGSARESVVYHCNSGMGIVRLKYFALMNLRLVVRKVQMIWSLGRSFEINFGSRVLKVVLWHRGCQNTWKGDEIQVEVSLHVRWNA